jgi:anti-sigma regulatory factor (Ser/Thr protein kinase)
MIRQREDSAIRHSLCRQLPPDVASPALARKAARQFFSDHVRDIDVLDQMLLATSELVTNAVKFGRVGAPIWMHLLATKELLAITITDTGSGGPADVTLKERAEGSSHSAVMAESGRGIDIVRELSDELAVFAGTITIVRAAVHVGPAA